MKICFKMSKILHLWLEFRPETFTVYFKCTYEPIFAKNTKLKNVTPHKVFWLYLSFTFRPEASHFERIGRKFQSRKQNFVLYFGPFLISPPF